jgi:hypothetical protein
VSDTTRPEHAAASVGRNTLRRGIPLAPQPERADVPFPGASTETGAGARGRFAEGPACCEKMINEMTQNRVGERESASITLLDVISMIAI